MATSKIISSSEASRCILNQYFESRNFIQELLYGRDLDVLKIIDTLERVRKKWADEVQQNIRLREQVKELESDRDLQRQKLSSSNEELRHARAQLAALMSEMDELKIEYSEMERKFDLVKELVKPEISHLNGEAQLKYAFLNDYTAGQKVSVHSTRLPPGRKTNGSQDDGVDYDKTDDTIDQPSYGEPNEEDSCLRSGKVFRRFKEVPSKRSRGSPYTNTNTLITTTTTVTVDPNGNAPPKAKVSIRRSFNRSMSESNILLDRHQRIAESTAKFNPLTPRCGTTSTVDLRSPLVSSRSWVRGTTIENRGHTYIGLKLIFSEKCDVCGCWIRWGGKPAWKCSDCNLHVHKSCAGRAPLPCIPLTPTPRAAGKQRPRLKDFCPNSQPMIPHSIIHCVIALERYYLNSEGLYRIPGQESQILKLLNDFKHARYQPKLEIQDPETITGYIKRFLLQLRDSLIPSSSWTEFVAAAKQGDEASVFAAIDQCVMDLPIPNRDTLAYLCCHFQKVCENSSRNKMTPEVLARSVAPTIVGRAPVRTMNIAQSTDEAAKQTQVMLAFLKMPRDYWSKFYSSDTIPRGAESVNSRALAPSAKQQIMDDRTPRRHLKPIDYRDARISPSAADRSILGPIRTPPSDSNIRSAQPILRRENFFRTPY
ncbi:unnamed protein product [Enterobius vermicularis]|uniref:Rac GTPase-activating protein 1 n=1 Tax=Enterobius vermicularis TaxID=51028 RepID=A0A0N4V598_ENTVE|nr:unnamed protein product [Enterobius vermicularis]